MFCLEWDNLEWPAWHSQVTTISSPLPSHLRQDTATRLPQDNSIQPTLCKWLEGKLGGWASEQVERAQSISDGWGLFIFTSPATATELWTKEAGDGSGGWGGQWAGGSRAHSIFIHPITASATAKWHTVMAAMARDGKMGSLQLPLLLYTLSTCLLTCLSCSPSSHLWQIVPPSELVTWSCPVATWQW